MNELRFKASSRRIEENNKFIFKRFFKYLKTKYYEKLTDVKQQLYDDFFKSGFDEAEFNSIFESENKRPSKHADKYGKKIRWAFYSKEIDQHSHPKNTGYSQN